MRGVIEGLASPHPLRDALPGMYGDDGFVQRFTAALDDVVAPVFGVLDNSDAYLDPWLTPEDFLAWLGQWVGIALNDDWPAARRRTLVARASELWRLRGTATGLANLVEALTGQVPEIEEGGGVAWSSVPGGALPGSGSNRLTVRLRVADPATFDVAGLEALVAAAKPAHLEHIVEVVASGDGDAARDEPAR